ncbi:uncharacterized protein EI97DRAFT_433344 [Westerdykella ornata]|uniref:RING-type domain-containing protein n=1 Tax=Westerdykella ornata TaxID=318751 RepID=A0A6A6JIV4_WESOR|nr:uncharacterized protein EI97DRAFT_433344 [Westerdykella ornata]KAF2276511.1 hypothetical protein EI97DRAFT_433344 [Westerdykella ornata]
MEPVPLRAAIGADMAKNFQYTDADVTASDECFICMQPYAPFNPVGCHAIKLKPCGHVVGFQCLSKWNATNPEAACLLCRQRLALQFASKIDQVLLWLARSEFFDAFDDLLAAMHRDDDPRKTYHLRNALVRGEITISERLRLLRDVVELHSWVHAVIAVIYIFGLALVSAGTQIVFSALENTTVGCAEALVPRWRPQAAAFLQGVDIWIFGEGNVIWRLVHLRPIPWIIIRTLLGAHGFLYAFFVSTSMAICLLAGRH